MALAGMNLSPTTMLANIGLFGDSRASASNATKATMKDGVQVVNMTATVRAIPRIHYM